MMISGFDSAYRFSWGPKGTASVSRQRALIKRRGAGLVAMALLASVALLPGRAVAAENDAVRVWNERAVLTLANGPTGSPSGLQFAPPVAMIHLAIVQGAVYDAVNAIKGGHHPYIKGLKAATSASKGAAAATAAHHVLVALVDQAPLTTDLTPAVKNGIKSRLDTEYAASLAEIASGQARDKGIEVGAAAAAAMLASRVGDGRFIPAPFVVGTAAGEWRPSPGNDPNGWVSNVRPFTLPSSHYYHTPGPLPLASSEYATEFNEVKAKGRATGSTRTADETALGIWSSRHPALMLYPALRDVAAAKGLTISEQARFHAMTSMSAADSLINCWAEKRHWNFWRPVTAIQLAADDGNNATVAEADWASLGTLPPYPDEPSGANCVYSGVMNSAKLFFGSDLASFSITGTGSTRSYTRFSDVIRDMIEARIFLGIHFRRPDVNGADLGRRIAEYVDANFFNCGPPGQCRQEERE